MCWNGDDHKEELSQAVQHHRAVWQEKALTVPAGLEAGIHSEAGKVMAV